MSKKKRAVTEPPAEGTIMKLQPVLQDQFQARVYSNFVFVTHTEYDFGLDFAEIMSPSPIIETEGEKAVGLPIKTRVVLPLKILPGLIDALKRQLEKYESEQSEKTKNDDKSA